MRRAQSHYNDTMDYESNEMRELLTTQYDATVSENQIQISPEQLENYVQAMAQMLLADQKKEETQTTYEDTYRSVFAPLYESADFHTLLEKTARFMERSIVLIDLGFHVIDYSREVKVTDALWTSIIHRGYCSYEFITAINEMLPADRLPKTPEAFTVTCPVSDEIKLCSLLFYKKHPIGYVILLDNKKGILPYHQQFLPRISKKLAKALRYHEEYSDLFTSATTEILTNLLGGNTLEDDEYLLLSKTLQMPGTFRMYLIRGHYNTVHDASYLRNQLHNFPQLQYVFIYHNYIIAIARTEKDAELRQAFLATSLREQVYDIACSNVFFRIEDIPAQYRHTKASFALAGKLGRHEFLHSWEEYEFYQVLNDCKDKNELLCYVHPAVYTLMDYDNTKDGQLLPTLKSYIRCGLRIKDTAAALYVHRNTLTYRLKKITELTGIDLDDISEIVRLDRSVKILEFMG